MTKQFIINEKDLASIEEAIHVLREHVQARSDPTEGALNETRSALAGLLCIMPSPREEATWTKQ